MTLDGNDIPALGTILKHLGEMETDSNATEQPAFLELLQATKGYVENLILKEKEDLIPLEEGVDILQAFYHHIKNRQEYKGDTSSVLEKLGYKKPASESNETAIESKPASGIDVEKSEQKTSNSESLIEEDREILTGFVMESLENLEAVEVSLIDLEENPDDIDSINAIFRSFHTIKGVSGFLNLDRINLLAHRAENLLDKARSGEIAIEETIVDIILESVDVLKKLIEGVQYGLDNNVSLDIGLDITPLINRIDEIQEVADNVRGKPIGEILIQKKEITPEKLAKGLEKQKQEPGKKIGQILVEEKSVESKTVVSALRDQKKGGMRHVDLQVKVDTKKLDNLVDLTGELVIAQSMLRQHPAILEAKNQQLLHNLGQLNQITAGLQTTAMSMRMVPIKSTFQKMVRLIRDLAKSSGKEVNLKMSGEDTEIDRNMVDELYEPMVHMIRNSIDHGIETGEDRLQAGKDKSGEIHLMAYHQGGCIVVEISDDGLGLNKERIIEKAKANRLITDEKELSDDEIYNLIFQPGFSTAKQVTDISGRGVGMDVVKKAIEKLKGRVEINSRPGQGSKFIIKLPLTLAIIEGMLVRVGNERYVIPALGIRESFRPTKEQYSTVEGKGEIILSRGKIIRLVRIDRIFNVKNHSKDPWEALIVTVEYDGQQMCLLIDELLGKEEVVIKSLGETFKDTKGIAGG
ncbi:MAG: chemotaxis protein CheA, partial [Planctomycetes bacterium]|nr:chemotaxis protein CheA [Planctomycetota bacterium]